MTTTPSTAPRRSAERCYSPPAPASRTSAPAHRGRRPFVDTADVLLVVEITTADTAVTDRITRPVLYAEAGIGHLWRLDLEPAPHLRVGALEGGAYATVARVPAGRSARIPAPLAVQLAPAGLAAPPAR
ncbi:Uma2 family endonuclease (plasmid) [Streptomyces uncialis]|uniref:Uma2 family endonuclease n=1 Tax=Streptomyces uncialis TaxID=1048205 RepID=UPI002E2F4B08|nr:Uma2 family endonuclease [Streptomyces uncialis]WTE16028.1 Uma2 family endonuclease [Streptomyces uncialis]